MKTCDIAVYGLGVMGSSLAKNIMSHGFAVAAYSKSPEERARFQRDTGADTVCTTVDEMLEGLQSPRCIFLMITAGRPVDMVLEELCPRLRPGDVILDGGNSFYRDTGRRYEECRKQGICYVGIGVSGGEKGALYGPSMMAGGSLEGWKQTRHILQTISAHADGKPCCDYIAAGGGGHYVKMVHNGIEYAILQLIAEIWYFMSSTLEMSGEEILSCFQSWKKGGLDSYLMEISIQVLQKKDKDGSLLVDKILDVAEQKGTGKWTMQDSLERGVYIPTIYEALSARNFSGKKRLRMQGSEQLQATVQKVFVENPEETLGNALLLGMILSYSQGFELIAKASAEENWAIDFGRLIDVWSNGCIIRSRLLAKIRQTGILISADEPLLLEQGFSWLKELEPALRETVGKSVLSGTPLPALAGALGYYDYYRMKQMPVNFIQALRDCFGAHTYQRTDREGHFHTNWEE
ncbi:MAG: NADP-dependent phosphogluconate dehydrogenase [Lachnospiraceae bacterium]|nr:NADP-dependent phosphogluconate dehydrogenase [Lachnospiraceae bacterium]